MPDERPTILPTKPIEPRIEIDPNGARRPIELAKNIFPETPMSEEYGIEKLEEVIAGVGDLGESIADILADGKVSLTDIPTAVSAVVKTVSLIGDLPGAALEAADLSEEEIKILGPQALAMVFRIINKLRAAA